MLFALGMSRDYKERKRFALLPTRVGYTGGNERTGRPVYIWLQWYTEDRWGSCYTRHYGEYRYDFQSVW